MDTLMLNEMKILLDCFEHRVPMNIAEGHDFATNVLYIKFMLALAEENTVLRSELHKVRQEINELIKDLYM